MGRFSWCATSSESEREIDDEDVYLPETNGFLEKCYYCNGRMEVETEKETPFAGRLTYRCANHGNGAEHESKWWDVAVTEEIESLKRSAEEQSGKLEEVAVNKEVDMVNSEELLARVRSLEESILNLSDCVDECSMEIKKIDSGNSTFAGVFGSAINSVGVDRHRRVILLVLGLSLLGNIYLVFRKT